ncbi:MAG: hypothetical protein IMF05_07000 [Proteobacteria bacterium]|nr:hypothetical protein [Pseudomonadota bacterium]
MMSITVFVRAMLRFLACGAVLALAGACQAEKMAKGDQPLVTVKGSVVTEGGAPASDCKLEFYDTAAVKPNYVWDVPADFTHRIQTAKVAKDFYFRVRCKGARMAARSRIYNMTYLSDNDFVVDLGRVTVGAGMIAVTGQVATQDGSVPAACKLGLYTGFHSKPSVSWDVAGAIAVEFEREKVDEHFQFRLECEGYSEPYNSPKRPESWLDEAGGKIELGAMLVRK